MHLLNGQPRTHQEISIYNSLKCFVQNWNIQNINSDFSCEDWLNSECELPAEINSLIINEGNSDSIDTHISEITDLDNFLAYTFSEGMPSEYKEIELNVQMSYNLW